MYPELKYVGKAKEQGDGIGDGIYEVEGGGEVVLPGDFSYGFELTGPALADPRRVLVVKGGIPWDVTLAKAKRLSLPLEKQFKLDE